MSGNEKKRRWPGNAGQTSTEYILLLFAVMGIISILTKQIKLHVMAPCNVNRKSIYCNLQVAYDRTDFRFYRLTGGVKR